MDILMIAPQPFLEPRGTPISVYQRVQGLATLGHTIDLVTYHIGQDVQIPGVTIHRIPHVPFIKQVKVGPSWAKPLLDLLIFWTAFRLLTTKQYDVIHSHEEAAFFSGLLAGMFHTRHLYDMHSSLPQQLRNFNFGNARPLVRLFEFLERRTLTTCDAVITIGSDLAAYVESINPAVKHVTIDNMALQDVIRASSSLSMNALRTRLGLDGRFPIVYTGTFERYQGVDLLIASAELIRLQCPEAAFVLVGGKPHQIEGWRAEVNRRHLADSILFTGSAPLDDLTAYLDLAEVLVSPRIEGTSVPLKIYTYLLSGKPIVATTLPAHTLILNNETAVLTELTPEAFAAGILQLIHDPMLRVRLGRQARRYAEERYDPATYLAKLDTIYRMLEPQQMVEQPLTF